MAAAMERRLDLGEGWDLGEEGRGQAVMLVKQRGKVATATPGSPGLDCWRVLTRRICGRD